MRVQTLALVWPETLMRSHRLSRTLIDFERAQIFHESQLMRVLKFEVTLDDSCSRLARVDDSR